MMDHLHNTPRSSCGCCSTKAGATRHRRAREWMESYESETVPVNEASGWQDKGSGKIFRQTRIHGASMRSLEDKRAVVLGEFRSFSLLVPDHSWQTTA